MTLKRLLVALIAFAAVGCATTDGPDSEPPGLTQEQRQQVARQFYDLVTCTDCDFDFERVAVPEKYAIPKDDLSRCFYFVFDQVTDSRNVMISSLMDCLETSR